MYSISSTGQTTQTYWLKIRQSPNKRTWMCIQSAPRLITFDIIELMLHVQQSRLSLIFPVGQCPNLLIRLRAAKPMKKVTDK